MSELKRAVSTQVKIKVFRAIESGIRMQTVADAMGLTLEKVKEIRSRTNADIKAVTSFLQTATTTQKKMMAPTKPNINEYYSQGFRSCEAMQYRPERKTQQA